VREREKETSSFWLVVGLRERERERGGVLVRVVHVLCERLWGSGEKFTRG